MAFTPILNTFDRRLLQEVATRDGGNTQPHDFDKKGITMGGIGSGGPVYQQATVSTEKFTERKTLHQQRLLRFVALPTIPTAGLWQSPQSGHPPLIKINPDKGLTVFLHSA